MLPWKLYLKWIVSSKPMHLRLVPNVKTIIAFGEGWGSVQTHGWQWPCIPRVPPLRSKCLTYFPIVWRQLESSLKRVLGDENLLQSFDAKRKGVVVSGWGNLQIHCWNTLLAMYLIVASMEKQVSDPLFLPIKDTNTLTKIKSIYHATTHSFKFKLSTSVNESKTKA